MQDANVLWSIYNIDYNLTELYFEITDTQDMGNLLLRSPQFLTASSTSPAMLSAKLELSIDSVLQYTIIKNAIDNKVVFDIAELARDFISHSISQTNKANTIAISADVTKYEGLDGTGNTIGIVDSTSYVGYDGYGRFSEGVNPTVSSSNAVIQSNTKLYFPPDTAGYICVNYGDNAVDFTSTATSIDVLGTTYDIVRVCDPIYRDIKLTFVNKFGCLQELWFFHKSIESLQFKSEQYKANIFDFSSSDYDTTKHQFATFNVNGRERIKLNTPLVDETYNDVLEEVLLSEFVWLNIESVNYPVKPITNTFIRKTSANDKIVQYTMDFEFANQYINDVR